jgi:hypothetical protein
MGVEISVSETGTIFEITVINSQGGAVDISSATDLTIQLRTPRLNIISRTATYTTDGVDGKIRYTITANDINGLGVWEIRGRYVDSGDTKHTVWGTFIAIE